MRRKPTPLIFAEIAQNHLKMNSSAGVWRGWRFLSHACKPTGCPPFHAHHNTNSANIGKRLPLRPKRSQDFFKHRMSLTIMGVWETLSKTSVGDYLHTKWEICTGSQFERKKCGIWLAMAFMLRKCGIWLAMAFMLRERSLVCSLFGPKGNTKLSSPEGLEPSVDLGNWNRLPQRSEHLLGRQRTLTGRKVTALKRRFLYPGFKDTSDLLSGRALKPIGLTHHLRRPRQSAFFGDG